MTANNPVVNQLRHELELGGGRVVERRVAPFIDIAINKRLDYYHQGGDIIDSEGNVLGYRENPGWFLYGYKWQDDPEFNMHGADYLEKNPAYQARVEESRRKIALLVAAARGELSGGVLNNG